MVKGGVRVLQEHTERWLKMSKIARSLLRIVKRTMLEIMKNLVK